MDSNINNRTGHSRINLDKDINSWRIVVDAIQ